MTGRTRGHSERVRVFTDVLAAELHLSQGARDRLRWASLLHDLGKIGVPATVLNKPAALEAVEWDMIRQHPDQGAVLAGPLLEWLGEWGTAISQHHERFDGTGYPRGLAGHEISQAGRIVAVADVFEVMTAARSYKRPMSVAAARRQLADSAGTQLDPACVTSVPGSQPAACVVGGRTPGPVGEPAVPAPGRRGRSSRRACGHGGSGAGGHGRGRRDNRGGSRRSGGKPGRGRAPQRRTPVAGQLIGARCGTCSVPDGLRSPGFGRSPFLPLGRAKRPFPRRPPRRPRLVGSRRRARVPARRRHLVRRPHPEHPRPEPLRQRRRTSQPRTRARRTSPQQRRWASQPWTRARRTWRQPSPSRSPSRWAAPRASRSSPGRPSPTPVSPC